MRKRRRVKIAIAACLLLGGFFIARHLLLPPVPAHRGDGSFRDTSFFFWVLPIRGYSITMPEFDLSQPIEAEYRLASLTDIGKECGVYLAIRDRQWSGETKQIGGQLRFELLDSQGHVVTDVSGRLGEFWWATSGRRSELYQLDKSFFTPRSGEEYRLRLFYTPDPSLVGHKGFVYLRSGGSV